jgi:hypothetical protein
VFIRVQVQGEDGALLDDVEGVERLREHVSGRHLHPADRRPVQGEAFVELPVDEAGSFAAQEIVGPLEALLDGGRCPLLCSGPDEPGSPLARPADHHRSELRAD